MGVGGQVVKTEMGSPRKKVCVLKTRRMNSTMETSTKTKYDKKTEKLAKAYVEFMNMPRMEGENEWMWHDRLARLVARKISPTAVGWAMFGGEDKWTYTIRQGNLFIFFDPPKMT